MLVLVALLPTAGASASTVNAGAEFRKVCPDFVRKQIPDDPGELSATLVGGNSLELGFIGSSDVVPTGPETAIDAQFMSPPNQNPYFALIFYEKSGFIWGLPRTFTIREGNRYDPSNGTDQSGAIRLQFRTSRGRYEIDHGSVAITRFSDGGSSGQFHIWRIKGSISGTLALARGSVKNRKSPPPATLDISAAAFNCILIQDIDPIPNNGLGQVTMQLEGFDHPVLNLAAQASSCSYTPDPPGPAFRLEVPADQQMYQLVFEVRSASNIAWPPSDGYLLSPETVDPPMLLVGDRTYAPLVMSFIIRPMPEIEMQYSPVSGHWSFDSAQLLLAGPRKEYWRLKGSFDASLTLNYRGVDRKIGLGNTPITLQLSPGSDYERIKIVAGHFDLLVRRDAVAAPLWKRLHPNLDPNVANQAPPSR